MSQKLHFSFGPFPFNCSAVEKSQYVYLSNVLYLLNTFCSHTCNSFRALFASSWTFGNNDLFKLSHLGQVVCDAACLGFGALFSRAVDGRSVEGLAPYTLTGHLKDIWKLVLPLPVLPTENKTVQMYRSYLYRMKRLQPQSVDLRTCASTHVR